MSSGISLAMHGVRDSEFSQDASPGKYEGDAVGDGEEGRERERNIPVPSPLH